MSEDSLSLHLVELSPQMRQIQESALCGYFHGHSHDRTSKIGDKNTHDQDPKKMYEHHAVTKYGRYIVFQF